MPDDGNGAAESLRHKKSHVTEVSINSLYVDDRFQRALNPNKVLRIKNAYHPQGIGHLLVARVTEPGVVPPAEYAVIDGQTRWRALTELAAEIQEGTTAAEGFSPVAQVEMFDGLTVNEAAFLFRLRNDQSPVRPAERDRIMVTEGNPIMVEVVRQSADAGFVVFSDDESRPATMPYLAEAKRIVTWGMKYKRPQLLTEALNIQAEAFGTALGSIDRQILQATADLLRKNNSLSEEELARVMTTLGIPGLRAQAEALSSRISKRMHGCLQIVLAEAYNKGKRGRDEKIRP